MKNIWVPLSGQIAQQRKVETIANNIANANTAGFKKDQLAFKEHLTALTKGADTIDLPRKEWGPDDFYRSQGGENAFVKVDGSYTDFSQGALTPTNNPLDLALFGKGFFANPIEDRIIKIPSNLKISISKEGDIFNKDGNLGKISVVEFNDPHALKKQGHSLYINNAQENLKNEAIKTTVNQGFIEGSNVNAIKEMSELINAHRHFENIQKAISTYDQISGQIVNDIADFR